MTNYKINRNKPGLSEDQISRHKDFSKVLSDHQKVLKYKDATRPLYKNPKFMGLITLLCVVLLVFVITEKEHEHKAEPKAPDSVATPARTIPSEIRQEAPVIQDTDTVKDTVIREEIKNKASFHLPGVPGKIFTVDPAAGAVLYAGSTRILVPPYAFKDQHGKKVLTPVEIHYREFTDPADAFLAGIPMHYDSAGVEQLVSAGMFEIRGFSAKQPVALKEAITVEMATPAHKGYNTYFLNESSKKWEFKSTENKSMRFMLNADEKQFPELKPFKDLIWEFVAKDPEQYNYVFSKTWSQFFLDEKLKPAPTNARLKQRASEPKFVVRPVALTGNKELNNQVIEAKYEEYYEALKKKERDGELLEQARLKQQEWLRSPEGQSYLKWTKTPEGQKQILSSRIISVFTVNQFGVWNCDTPSRLPQGASVAATFTDQGGKKLQVSGVYLADYSINSVFNYFHGANIRFNPASRNILWAALPEGKLAIFTPDRFKTIPAKGNAVFKMEVVDINGKSAADIKKLLGMQQHATGRQEEKDQDPVATYERMINMKKEPREDMLYTKEGTGTINNNGRRVFSETDRLKKEAAERRKAEEERLKKEAAQKLRDVQPFDSK